MFGRIKKEFWLVLLLGVTAKTIYFLPYIRSQFYDAMIAATGLTNTQLGVLMAVYAIVNFLVYLPGGVLADRFSPRKLATGSLLITGFSGFLFILYKPYGLMLLLHAFWGITTVLTFWSAVIRIVRESGPDEEQGKLFGIWQMGKGLGATIFGFLAIPIFNYFGEGIEGLTMVSIYYSVVNIGFGIWVWFAMKGHPSDSRNENVETPEERRRKTLAVLKIPQIWIAGFMMFCLYCVFVAGSMNIAYLTQIMGMTETNASIVQTFNMSVLFILGGAISMVISDKFKSKTTFVFAVLVILLASIGIYIAIPSEPRFAGLFVTVMSLCTLIYYSGYANLYAFIAEFDIPEELSGTASGILSLMCYLPEIFGFTLCGYLIDQTPGAQGFRHVFYFAGACVVLGIITASVLAVMNRKVAAKKAEVVEAE